MMKTQLLLFLLFAASFLPAKAQTYQPSAENLKARQEFQDNKFGIFLHWGLYCMLATGEWTMTNKDLNYKEYAKLAGGFYPSKFSAAEWVSAIKASGAKYICFTSRHHEGFSMFHTKYSDYNIVDATPFKRDIVKELEKPGRDPRDEMPKPILRTDVLDMKDLKEGMVLKGTVRNVIDFGAFVDIGVHQDGLVHISQMTDRYIKHPLEVVSVGDIIDVQVMSVDLNKKRIQLTMKIDHNK